MTSDKLPDDLESAFPLTPWSSILRGAEGDVEAKRELFRRLLGLYWRPIYTSLRAGWGLGPEEARVRVQEYFHEVLSGEALAQLDPAEGRFRDFLKERLVDFMRRAEEGAGPETAPRETGLADPAEAEPLAAEPGDPEAVFDRDWTRLLIERALERFAGGASAENRRSPEGLFRIFDVEGCERRPVEVAAELGLAEDDLRDRLHAGRKAFRRAVASEIHEYALDDRDARQELTWTIG